MPRSARDGISRELPPLRPLAPGAAYLWRLTLISARAPVAAEGAGKLVTRWHVARLPPYHVADRDYGTTRAAARRTISPLRAHALCGHAPPSRANRPTLGEWWLAQPLYIQPDAALLRADWAGSPGYCQRCGAALAAVLDEIERLRAHEGHP